MKDMAISKGNIIPEVGDEVVGFKFDSCDGHDVKWDSDMEDYIGERGVVMVEDVAAEKSEEDMSDPRNWKKGDIVVCTNDSGYDDFIEGEIYTLREDCDGKIARVVADSSGIENGWGVQFFKFHSRPVK